jgi:hypothetical protein
LWGVHRLQPSLPTDATATLDLRVIAINGIYICEHGISRGRASKGRVSKDRVSKDRVSKDRARRVRASRAVIVCTCRRVHMCHEGRVDDADGFTVFIDVRQHVLLGRAEMLGGHLQNIHAV